MRRLFLIVAAGLLLAAPPASDATAPHNGCVPKGTKIQEEGRGWVVFSRKVYLGAFSRWYACSDKYGKRVYLGDVTSDRFTSNIGHLIVNGRYAAVAQDENDKESSSVAVRVVDLKTGAETGAWGAGGGCAGWVRGLVLSAGGWAGVMNDGGCLNSYTQVIRVSPRRSLQIVAEAPRGMINRRSLRLRDGLLAWTEAGQRQGALLEESGEDPCRPGRSAPFIATGRVRVFRDVVEDHDAVFACLFDGGTPVQIDYRDDYYPRQPLVVSGAYVAWVGRAENEGWAVNLLDLATNARRRVLTVPVSGDDGQAQEIAALRLADNGAAVVGVRPGFRSRANAQIWKSPRPDTLMLVAEGPGIDVISLSITGRRITWTDGGKQMSAPLD